MIEIKQAKCGGRGVFAKRMIRRGVLFEKSPVILVPWTRLPPPLDEYVYVWNKKYAAIALGCGSLFNHSRSANADYRFDIRNKQMVYRAHRDILPNEEITINYNGNPDDPTPVWFDIIE